MTEMNYKSQHALSCCAHCLTLPSCLFLIAALVWTLICYIDACMLLIAFDMFVPRLTFDCHLTCILPNILDLLAKCLIKRLAAFPSNCGGVYAKSTDP